MGQPSHTFPLLKLYTKREGHYILQHSFSCSEFLNYVRGLGNALPTVDDTSCFYQEERYTAGYAIANDRQAVYRLASDSQSFIYRPEQHELELRQREIDRNFRV